MVYYSPEGDRTYLAVDAILLPGLATARRQAAAAWNEEAGGHD